MRHVVGPAAPFLLALAMAGFGIATMPVRPIIAFAAGGLAVTFLNWLGYLVIDRRSNLPQTCRCQPTERGHDTGRREAQRQPTDLVADPRQQRADQAPGSVGHVVEAHVTGDPPGRPEGEDQIGMDRGVDREDKAEQQQPDHQRHG